MYSAVRVLVCIKYIDVHIKAREVKGEEVRGRLRILVRECILSPIQILRIISVRHP